MKTKRIIAAVFAFAITITNFSIVAFAAEEEIQTDVSTEAISTETTVETTTTDVTEVSEESTETTTEAIEDDSVSEEDTTITKALSILSGETFTIGDESFNASIEGYKLKIYNDRGLAFEKDIDITPPGIESIALSVNGNILNIKEYGDVGRLLHDYNVEYNSSTGKFGKIDYSQSDNYSFTFQGVSFYAVKTRETKERISAEGWTEYDQYNYLSIYFSDGTPTSIQNELVWIEYGRTGGFAGYSPSAHISISGDKLIIHRIIEPGNPSKDILTTYVLDKSTNNLVKSGSTSDTQEVTEQMLLDKFVALYGEPVEYKSGDFDNDGVLDMYCRMPLKNNYFRRYFVTMDKIIDVTQEEYDRPYVDGGNSYYYFSLNDGSKFSITVETHSTSGSGLGQYIHIDKINKDGALSTASIDRQTKVKTISGLKSSIIDPYDLNSILSVNENGITLTYYDGATGSRHSVDYTYDESSNSFVSDGNLPKEEVTEQMLLDKFTALYGEPYYYESGDFNNDGILDMYCSIFKDGQNQTYFVTMDNIILAKSNGTSIGGSLESYIYFKTNDGNQFRFTLYYRGAAFYVRASCSIDKINSDGTMTAVNINGSEGISVLYDEYFNDNSIGDTILEYPNDIAQGKLFEPSNYFSSNGDIITINRYVYDGENAGVGSTNYTYDADKNAFVVAGSTNNSGNSSNGSTNGVSNSPATGDNFSVIPFTLSIALVAGAATVVGIKNRKKREIEE